MSFLYRHAMGSVLILLSLAQFILTLDSTFMNVSISTLVKDLHTTVTGIQAAIAFYTLVMAACMIAGAKIGDIIGRKKAFVIGLIIYAVGSLITSMSNTIYILIFGWSLLEGIGAALIIPAMFSLVTANYREGQERVKAYGMLAAIAAMGAAVGPIIGGFLTTYLSWRLGFLLEVIIALYILLKRKKIQDAVVLAHDTAFDMLGFLLSAAGLGVLVTGILLANSYGILQARKPFVIFGTTLISKGGISPTIVVSGIGLLFLCSFVLWELSRKKQQKAQLLDIALFQNRFISSGVITNLSVQFVMVGTIFAVSLVSQIFLEYSAFNSGLVLLPLSVAVLIAGVLAGRMSKRFIVKRLVQVGVLCVVIGALILGVMVGKNPSGKSFMPGLFFIGLGAGMVLSQLNNLIQSSVGAEKTNEASGINSTCQYIGSSLGTSLAGSLIISFFILRSTNLVNQNTAFTQSQKNSINNALETKAQLVSTSQLRGYLSEVPQPLATELIAINSESQQKAISAAVMVIAILGVIGLLSSFFLPRTTSGV